MIWQLSLVLIFKECLSYLTDGLSNYHILYTKSVRKLNTNTLNSLLVLQSVKTPGTVCEIEISQNIPEEMKRSQIWNQWLLSCFHELQMVLRTSLY